MVTNSRLQAGAGLPSSRPQTSANCRSVRDFRSGVVSAFMKQCQSQRTCPHCGGASRTLIQQHRTSIIALPMKKRTAQAMVSAGLAEENLGGGAPAGAADDMDEDDSDEADSEADSDDSDEGKDPGASAPK